MDHEFFVSTVINRYVANPIAALFGLPADHDVLPAHFVMILLVALGLIVFGLVLRRRLSVESPGGLQQVLEVLTNGLLDLGRDIIGPQGDRFFPLCGALFLYILSSNLLGLIPGFMSPTADINVTAGCAVTVFIYYNWVGVREMGLFKYILHFAGPVLFLAPLMFAIEIVSHLARPVSLSLRLFGNIFAEELIVGTLNGIFPFLVSLPVMGLALFASTIQAFIFVVLTMVYLGGAFEHHDDDHGHGPAEEHAH